MKKKQLIFSIIRYAVVALILLFLLFPLYWVLITSFKENMEAYKFPPTFFPQLPTAKAYIKLFTEDQNFFRYYTNNFIVSGACAVLTTFLAIISGYALSRFHFKWNKWIIAAFTSAQMFPIVSRMISLYGLMGKMNLINTQEGLVFALTAAMIPFSTMLMASFFDSIPTVLEEAAFIDGAGRFKILFKVIMPLVKPGIVAVGIYSLLMTWDDYLHASTLIQTDSLRTLSAGVSVRYLGELSYDWSLINTISVIGVIPMLLLFFFFQKHLVKGLVQGAVKG